MARINQSKPMLFIVDTGFGGKLMVDDVIAQNLELEHLGSRTVNNLGMGNIVIEDYQGAIFSTDDITLTIPKVEAQKKLHLMLNQMGVDKNGNKPVGTISPWILTKGTLTFNAGLNSITVDDNDHLTPTMPGVIPYSFAAGIPTFKAKVAGHHFNAHLDTGSPAKLIIPSRFIEQFEFIQEPVARGGAKTVGRTHKLWTAKIKGSVDLGAVSIDDPDVLFIEGLPAINIGLSAFDGGKVRIDPTNELIEFQLKP